MSVPALRKLYEQDPGLVQGLETDWRLSVPLDAMLTAADIATRQPDIVAHLDTLSDEDPSTLDEIRQLITSLPGDIVYDNYGEEVLAWAAANSTLQDREESHRNTLTTRANYDRDLFDKACKWCWHEGGFSRKGKDVLLQYKIMQVISNGQIESIDLKTYLQQAPRPGVELSDKRIADYGLIPLRTQRDFALPNGPAIGFGWHDRVEPTIRYDIFLDAPTGFALTYKGKPNAFVSVAASSQEELMIYQLQGVRADKVDPQIPPDHDGYVVGKASSRGLPPLDWQKLLIDITTDLAQSLGLKSVGIQSAENNEWAQPVDGDGPLIDEATTIKAYDVPAQRLGFTKGRDRNWYLPIEIN